MKKNIRYHQSLEWFKVQAKLEAKTEKLWSINELDITGGEPDVVGYESAHRRIYILRLFSRKPKGRRSVCYEHEALEARRTISGAAKIREF